MTEKPLYERCRYDGEPYPCPIHVGCYAAGYDGCQDVQEIGHA